jgi:hypothetical protein
LPVFQQTILQASLPTMSDAAGDAQNFLSDFKSTRLRTTDSARRLNPRRQDPSSRQPSSNTTHFVCEKTTTLMVTIVDIFARHPTSKFLLILTALPATAASL